MNKYGKFVGLFREFYNEDNIKIDEKITDIAKSAYNEE